MDSKRTVSNLPHLTHCFALMLDLKKLINELPLGSTFQVY